MNYRERDFERLKAAVDAPPGRAGRLIEGLLLVASGASAVLFLWQLGSWVVRYMKGL